MEACNIRPFVTGLFPVLQCAPSSSVLWHVSEFPSLSRMGNIPWCVSTEFCLCIFPTDGHLSCVPPSAAVNRAAVDPGMGWSQMEESVCPG